MTTATTTKSVTYVSDRKRVLLIESEDYQYNQAGRRVGKIEPTRLSFSRETEFAASDNNYHCTISEYDGPRSELAGRAVVNGEVQGMDYDTLIAVVEEHRLFGRRFWHAGQSPAEKRPTLSELAGQVADASREELREMLETERSTHNRGEALALISEAALSDDVAAGETSDLGGDPS